VDAAFIKIASSRVAVRTYHHVATGQEYQFSVGHTNVASRTRAGDKRGSGFLYAPGAPVAIWV